jgi:hypothetical protein
MVQAVFEGVEPWRMPAWPARLRDSLAARLLAERERWGLWLPVGFTFGIGLYFALPVEPWPWIGAIAAMLGLGIAFFARRSLHAAAPAILAIALPLGVVASGFAAAQLETWRPATPMLDDPLGAVALAGRVVDIERQPDGVRVTLVPESIAHLDPGSLPHLIRIKLRGTPPPIAIDDRMSAEAELMPPAGPALPGGFDFQRQAWFRGIGGVGYALGKPSIQPGSAGGLAGRIRAWRAGIAARFRAALPGPEGSIAAAMVTGERGAIPAEINRDYRDSGLAHLLVIAGLHMTLVTGFVFFAVRALLALIPAIALRVPIKKWAAGVALAAAMLYLVLSGAAVPTERAFTMVALGLIAIMIDRFSLSMAAVGAGGGAGAGGRSVGADRRQLPDVLRRRRRSDRLLRDGGAGTLGATPGPGTARPFRAASARHRPDDAGGDARDGRLRHLSFQPLRPVFDHCQSGRGAACRLLGHALGRGLLPAAALRPGTDRPRADGLGPELDRAGRALDRRSAGCRARSAGDFWRRRWAVSGW